MIVPVDLNVRIEASLSSWNEYSLRTMISTSTATEPIAAASVMPVMPP